MKRDEFKELKKAHTKDINNFRKEVVKYCKKIKLDDTAKQEREAMEYCELSSALIFIGYNLFAYPSYFRIANILESIEKTKGSKSYSLALEVYNSFKEKAEELNKKEDELKVLSELVEKKTAIEKAVKNLQTDDNKEMIDNYLLSLESWKPTELINGEIVVNGENVGKSATVGVKIGNGIRIHIMDIEVVKDKKGNEVIGIRNDTRWRQSELNIIDIVEKIPKELVSLIK